jgi:YHS domain-containing protein
LCYDGGTLDKETVLVPLDPEQPDHSSRKRRRLVLVSLALGGFLLFLGVVGLWLADRFFPPHLEPISALPSPAPSPVSGAETVMDPVTRQPLDPALAVYQVDLYGTTFYFASRESLDRFREDPLRYVQPRVRIRVDLMDLGEEPGSGSQTPRDPGSEAGDAWMDPEDPPPPIEADRPGTSRAGLPGASEPFESPLPGEAPPPDEVGDPEPVLPDGEPGWLPGPGSSLPDPSPESNSPATVDPGGEDIILDERAP